MNTELKQSVYGRSRNRWKDEAAALSDICQKQETSPELLYAEHTPNKYVWKTIVGKPTIATTQPENVATNNLIKTYAKTDFETESQAVQQAMEDFETFETNLKKDHCEEFWSFSRIK